MAWHNLRPQTLVRVLALAAALLLFWLCISAGYVVSSLLVLGVVVLAIAELIRYVERGHLAMRRLTEAIRTDDFALHFTASPSDRSYRYLVASLNGVMNRFRKIHSERETANAFLDALLEALPVAVIVVDANDVISMANRAARLLPSVAVGNVLADESLRKLPNMVVRATRLVLLGRDMRVLMLHNIRPELTEREQQAWQQLLRVLTHELMNSLTPITSLAQTASQLPSAEADPDLRRALETLHRRSAGLLHFVASYRDLTREHTPAFEATDLTQLLGDLGQLFEPTFSEKNIAFLWHIPQNAATATADSALLEQVVVNVVKNAIEAGATTIACTAAIEGEHIALRISDDGKGISAEHWQHVFVPFFTTKPTGNGIGLSLSRQLMRAMGGDMLLSASPSGGVTVELRLAGFSPANAA